MKKLFFIAAIAGAALVSCTKNEIAPSVENEQAISFSSPIVGVTTKSSTTPQYGLISGAYPTGVNFGVWAWYCPGDGSYNHTVATPYMTNVEVGYNGGSSMNATETENGAWVSNPVYYWPKNGKLTFDAYSPIEISNKVTCDAQKGLTITDYSVPTTLDDQIDVLYSTRSLDKTSSVGQVGNTYEGVDIVFNHALAAITFTAKTADNYPTGTIALKSIVISANGKGTFTQNIGGTTEWESDTPSAYAVANFTNYDNSQKLTNTSVPVNEGAVTLMIPQPFSSLSPQSITVEYYIKNNDETPLLQTATFDLSLVANQSGNVPDGADEGTDPDAVTVDKWEMGKKYTYNLTIGLDGIYFAPTVNPWDDKTNVTLPDII